MDKGLSVTEGVLSKADKGLSGAERTLSVLEKVFGVTEGILSAPRKVADIEGKVLSGAEQGTFAARPGAGRPKKTTGGQNRRVKKYFCLPAQAACQILSTRSIVGQSSRKRSHRSHAECKQVTKPGSNDKKYLRKFSHIANTFRMREATGWQMKCPCRRNCGGLRAWEVNREK
jgi:hypothetical protein